MSQGPSYVTLTLTFDLDQISQGQGQDFRKKIYLVQPWRVVYQIKGLDPLIPEM